MGELTKIMVVVPTYNERENLPELVELLADLDAARPARAGRRRQLPRRHRRRRRQARDGAPIEVGVLHRTVKDGLGRAYVAGMTRALDEGADIVIQMDADLSHPASVIPAMVETLRTTDAARRARLAVRRRWRGGGRVAAGTARRCRPGPTST